MVKAVHHGHFSRLGTHPIGGVFFISIVGSIYRAEEMYRLFWVKRSTRRRISPVALVGLVWCCVCTTRDRG